MRRLTTSDNEVKQFLFKDTSIEVVDEQARQDIDNLAPVAKSGDYDDLENKPFLATVATTGDYDDLNNKPSLATVATTGNYDDLNNKPSLATVATTGDYDDLIDKPSLATVATSGSYNDLSDKPTIPIVNNGTLTIQKNGTNVQTFTANASSNVTANITMSKSDVGLGNVGNFKAVSTVANQGLTEDEKGNARSNIGAGSSSFSGDYNDLSNKPALKTVATSGSYNDLTDKPTIPTVNNATLTIQKNGTNVQTFTANASSNVTANITMSKSDVGLGNVGNFKAVSTVASQGLTDTEKSNARANIGAGSSSFSGDYNDLSNKPALKTVATSGSYNDLTNKPTIPTVNNATLTIQKNGTNVQTFTANASSNVTANITMSKSDVGLGNVGNFKAVSTVASQGLTDTEKSNARANIGAGTSSFSGSYTDLTNKPTIPTVNNATLTIQKNGTNVQTFTANASSNKTANITVPTKVSELTNDSGYTTNTGTVTQVKVGSTAYDPSSGIVSLPAYPTDTNNRRVFYGTCSTASATAAKVITLSDTTGWELKAGTTVVVRFTNTNTASNVTLNVNNSGAKSIYYNNAVYTGPVSAVCGYAKRTYVYTYDGTYWVWIAHGIDDNTTYSSKAAASGGTDVSLVTTGEKYTWNNKGTGTVTSVKVGSTSYSPSSGVVSLPAYPTVNNATLTIQKNGTNVQTFTANASSNVTANITVPTKVSELTNDSDYLKNGGKGATSSASLTVNTAYTTTSDGYLTMSSGASAGSAVIVSIQGSDGVGLASIFEVTATQNLGSSQAIYIKKGMKLLCTRKDSGCSAVFYPIVY